MPWASVRHVLRGVLNFATAAGAMAIHGHGGTAVVTITRVAGDVCAHCQCAAVGRPGNQTMVGVRNPRAL